MLTNKCLYIFTDRISACGGVKPGYILPQWTVFLLLWQRFINWRHFVEKFCWRVVSVVFGLLGWASQNIILATLMLLTRVWFGLEFMWGFCFIFIHLLKKALWVIWTSNDDANWAAVWLLGTSLRVSCAPWQSLVWNRVLYQSKIIGQVWNRVLNHTFWSRVRVSRSVIYKPTQMV